MCWLLRCPPCTGQTGVKTIHSTGCTRPRLRVTRERDSNRPPFCFNGTARFFKNFKIYRLKVVAQRTLRAGYTSRRRGDKGVVLIVMLRTSYTHRPSLDRHGNERRDKTALCCFLTVRSSRQHVQNTQSTHLFLWSSNR